MFETTQQQVRERAQEVAQETAEQTRSEVGRRAFETLEEYFPEAASARTRRDRVAMLVVGFALGLIFGVLVSR